MLQLKTTIEEIQSNPDITLTTLNEKWKAAPNGWEKYAVSNLGRMYNLATKRFVRFSRSGFYMSSNNRRKVSRKYLTVSLRNNSITGKDLHTVVHKMVALTWIENTDPDNLTLVDHINNDPLDNRVENLRWVTNKFNTLQSKNDEQQKYTRWLIQNSKECA